MAKNEFAVKAQVYSILGDVLESLENRKSGAVENYESYASRLEESPDEYWCKSCMEEAQRVIDACDTVIEKLKKTF